jgi:hypothetical protein
VTAVASIATVTTTQAHAASCEFHVNGQSGIVDKVTGSCTHSTSSGNGAFNDNEHLSKP